jgi:hypothetical protein
MRRAAVVMVGLVLGMGCQKPSAPAPDTNATPAAPAAPAAPAPAPVAPAAAEQGPATAGGLAWDGAAPLVRRKPKSSMRAAEYGVEGDDQAELTVFYFGADQGGSIEANVARWFSQFKQADGSDTAKKAKQSERDVGGIAVTVVEADGHYSGGMAMPGAPAPAEMPDAMLLGAIARGPRGAVFFKLVGPRAAIERARPGFDALVGSLRAAP